MQLFIEDIELRHPGSSGERLSRLSGFPEASLQPLEILLDASPDPDQAIHFLIRMLKDAPDALARIVASSTALRYVVAVFGYSIFLAEAILRNPAWILDTAASDDLHRVLRVDEYIDLLTQYLGPSALLPSAYLLAGFRRREILRILLRDVLRLGALSDITEELSNLADAILSVSLAAIRRSLQTRLDAPPAGEFTVIALGKLGGRGAQLQFGYRPDVRLLGRRDRNRPRLYP